MSVDGKSFRSLSSHDQSSSPSSDSGSNTDSPVLSSSFDHSLSPYVVFSLSFSSFFNVSFTVLHARNLLFGYRKNTLSRSLIPFTFLILFLLSVGHQH
ncbi:hypothetical protein F5878DRAFT_200783 [Lentinula raphanica]|uniref:Uncharacterized protein n=1 Tax=Lentinula raphanica TaxID=153919 RepID=A0AA38PJT9_9AGAR|nr:hypothetical protein F5878DRAFT_200783 [Lentinula raphanica]